MDWNNLSKNQKLDFIVKLMDVESSIQDLKDDVMQIVLFNDMLDEWWSSETSDAQEQEWKTLSNDAKMDAVEKELDDWDKMALIEFLIDNMSLEQIETFKVLFEGKA